MLEPLGLHGAHAVLGDEGVGLQWHLYQASLPGAVVDPQEATTLEVCMTKLCPLKVGPPTAAVLSCACMSAQAVCSVGEPAASSSLLALTAQ